MENMHRRHFFQTMVGMSSLVLASCSTSPPRVHRVGFFTLPRADVAGNAEKLTTEITRLLRAGQHVKVVAFPCDAPNRVSKTMCGDIDVAIAASAEFAERLHEVAPQLPVIFASGSDPVVEGLAETMARPGKGATGFTYDLPIDGARAELLKSCVPLAKHIGVIVDDWYVQKAKPIRDLEETFQALNCAATVLVATDADTLRMAVLRSSTLKCDAIYFPLSTAIEGNESVAAKAVRESSLPAIYPYEECVRTGGLMSYEALIVEPFAILARHCALVLTGTPVGEIPIESPSRFRTVLNFDAAREIGLRFPTQTILNADSHVGARKL